jgi:small subunit ribosomal protein S20
MAKKDLSVLKALRQSKKRRLRNISVKSTVKTAFKKAKTAIKKKIEGAKETAIRAISLIDRAVSKGIIHKNTAARKKSRLIKKLNKSA